MLDPYYRPTSIPDIPNEDPSISHLLNRFGTVKPLTALHAPTGNANVPGFGFQGDERTGLFSIHPGRLGVSIFGVCVLEISQYEIKVNTPSGDMVIPHTPDVYSIDGGSVYLNQVDKVDGGDVSGYQWRLADGGAPYIVNVYRSRDGGNPRGARYSVFDGGYVRGNLSGFAAIYRDGGTPTLWR